MGLRLHTVRPLQGWRWIQQAFKLWLTRPLAFVGLFTFFLLAVLLLALVVPVVGGVLGLALLPMLTLGFMVASRAALAGQLVHPLQLIEGLRHPDRARRRGQWALCAGFALATLALMLLAHWVDDGLFEQLQRLWAESRGDRTKEIDKILDDPRLVQGLMVRLLGAAALSVPFWHAPALVHWGGQGALQSLFSSTLALWQARAAFVVYLLGWLAVAIGIALLLSLVARLSGSPQIIGVLALPLGLAVTAVFYVSLWFSFDDSFHPAETAAPTAP